MILKEYRICMPMTVEEVREKFDLIDKMAKCNQIALTSVPAR